MITGNQKTLWIHTTHILVTLANSNRTKDDKPVLFKDVYPFTEKVEREPDELDQLLEKAKWDKLKNEQQQRGR